MSSKTLQLVVLSVLFASCLLPLIAGSPSIDLKATETKLRQQMVGKVAVLRNFYKGSDLAFDSQGNLVGDTKTGPWTYYARVEVSSIKLTQDSLIIKGSRNVVKWELSASEFQNYTLDDRPVRIAIGLEPGFTESDLASVIGRVFLTRATLLSDVVPEFWKDILTTDRARRAEWDGQENAIMKRVSELSSQISPPRLLSGSNGIDISTKPFKEFAPNNLLVSFVVNESGTVERLQIDKPVGLGLDDPVLETISAWKWQPAMRGETPVAVLMYAKVLFPGEKGHVDPRLLRCEPGNCDIQKPRP